MEENTEKREDNRLDIPFILMDEEDGFSDKKILDISGQHEHSPLETSPCRMKHILNNSEISKHLKKLPLAINVSDTSSENGWKNAFGQLEMLEKMPYFGPVCILTDSKIEKEVAERLGLFRLRTIVVYDIDPENLSEDVLISVENLVFERVPLLINIKTSELSQYNHDNFEEMLKQLSDAGAKYFSFSEEETGKEELFDRLQDKSDVFIFKNLSCGITNALGLSYDYNIKFHYPERSRCVDCINFQKCTGYASNWKEKEYNEEIFEKMGIKAELIDVKGSDETATCGIYKRCNHVCSDCILKKGKKLVLNGSYSKKFLNITKWLVGIDVEPSEGLNGLNMTDKEIKKLENL